MSNIEDFFNSLMEKNWRNNISSEVSRELDSILDKLQESKDEVIKEVIKDLEIVEKMKVEEKETYDYAVFKKWVKNCTIQSLISVIEKKEEN